MGMEHRSRFLLLILGMFLSLTVRSETIALGQQLEDFCLPSINGFAKNLTEQRGMPVMLIWVDDCDRCDNALKEYEKLAQRYRNKGLISWVIWLPNAWQIQPQPAVMLVDRNGTLDYIFVGNLRKNLEFTNHALAYWLDGDDLVHQR